MRTERRGGETHVRDGRHEQREAREERVRPLVRERRVHLLAEERERHAEEVAREALACERGRREGAVAACTRITDPQKETEGVRSVSIFCACKLCTGSRTSLRGM